jgi:hypothetical protein
MPADLDVETTVSESLCESSLYATRPGSVLDVADSGDMALLTVHGSAHEGELRCRGLKPRVIVSKALPSCRDSGTMRLHQLLVCLAVWTVGSLAASEQVVADFYGRHASSSGHTNNWAVLVCASRYWFNYRVCPATVQ